MKEQFYIVLPSNSSMHMFTDNTITHFKTQLPRKIKLHGNWEVALTEIHIPMIVQHISTESSDGIVSVFTESNAVELNENASSVSSIESGVYSDVNSLIDEINGLECMKSHLKITKTRGGYVTISQICGSDCSAESHEVSFSKKLKRILGFETLLSNPSCSIKNGYPLTGERPANLTNALPNKIGRASCRERV